MTTKNEDIILERINQLEGKIERIEQLLLLMIEEEYLTEEEKKRIRKADEIVKKKEFEKLVLVK